MAASDQSDPATARSLPPERRAAPGGFLRQPRAAKSLRLVVALLLILVGYGSLFPFDYVPHEPGWADVVHLATEWPARLSNSDVLGNMLLFLPLGLLIPALSARTGARFAWSLFAIGYAWFLQYLQFWYPSRDPSGSDAVFNTVGLLLGLLFAAAAGSATSRWAARLNRESPLWAAAAAWMLLWLAYRWFPLVPTLDLDNIKAALKPLLLDPRWDAAHVLHDAAAWLLWFWLARRSALRELAAPGIAMLAAVAILAAEPLFVGGSISLSNLIGLAIALALAVPLSGPGYGAAWAQLALLGTSIAVSGLAPFTFDASNGFLWLPFAGMLSGSMVLNTASLIEKCYLYGGMLLLLGQLGFGWKTGAFLLALELAAVEGLQTMLPGRTAEITDPLLALLLAIGMRALLVSTNDPPIGRRWTAPRQPGPGPRRRRYVSRR